MAKYQFERKLIDATLEIAKEASKINWDGYDGLPISDETVNYAVRFIVLLPSLIPQPEIVPEPDGALSFDWFIATDKMMSISINSNALMCYAGLNGENKITGTEKMSDSFPKNILDFLKELYNL